MELKRFVGFLAFILFFCNFNYVANALTSDEQASITKLKDTISIETVDGMYDTTYGFDPTEGAIFLNIETDSDLKLFKYLSNDGKKKLMNDLAQSNWGEYLGVSVCYVTVVYSNKVYAFTEVQYDLDNANVSLDYFEQGSTNLTPWKNSAVNSNSNSSSESVKVPANVKLVTLKDQGVITNNSTMLPAAAVFSALGGSVQLNNKSSDITITYGNTKIQTKLNSKYATIDGVSTSYSVPFQVINEKLMVPFQLIKDLFKENATVKYDTFDQKYINAVVISTEHKKITVPVNDIYDTYKTYIGKKVWLNTPSMIIQDLNGNEAYSKVKNLSAVTIKNVTRSEISSDWLEVTFLYNGQTYVATFKSSYFKYDVLTQNPFKTYQFSKKNWEKIQNRSISIGMTKDMVYLSWGRYDRSSKDVYSWGTSELWVYEYTYSSDKYLYFVNGVLESMSSY